jgi:alpha-maltose-1-phosphate synthase
LRITFFTNEYPPNIYGGAGVHVDYLSRELARAENGAHSIDVLSFGEQDEKQGNLTVRGIPAPPGIPAQDARHARLLDAFERNLAMVGAAKSPDIIHCHTWYSHLAGCIARPLTGGKLVLTTHSLEPHRPWKVEQLGSAYYATEWVERTAYQNADGVIAVSQAMKADVQNLYGVSPEKVRVIHNGIDLDEYRLVSEPHTLRRLGIDPDKPIVLFVGRVTRQKGILHLARAITRLDAGMQVVLCAGAPDTKEIGEEMNALVAELLESAKAGRHAAVVHIPEMLPRNDVIALYSHADLFVCPSV